MANSDRRWNTGNLYDKLGFVKVSNGSPGYWYVKDGCRMHRFGWRKSVLSGRLDEFDSNLTEW